MAYPQNPDAALKALGMNPANLAQMLQVQFVGESRASLRSHPDLQVSVNRLRAAFRWLSENPWPFMEATMHHELWDTGQLDASLEHLLSQYEASTGSVEGNVPSEIIQGASNIPAEHAKVFSASPADCVAPDADDLADGTRQNI